MLLIQRILFLTVLLISCFGVQAKCQQTRQKYLSGTGKDHTVNWKFYCTGGQNSGKWTTIPVPSNWELQGFGTYAYGSDKKRPDEKGIYKHTFEVPTSWKNKSVNIVFEGVMTDAEVMINGEKAGPTHQGAFYQFKYDVSDLLKYGSGNKLKVTVSKQSANKSVNLAERHADYWIFGGIFRPVYLEAKPKEHIKRVAINAKADGNFSSDIYTSGLNKPASIYCQIKTTEGKKVGPSFKASVNPRTSMQTLSTTINQVKLWSPEFPNMYKAVFTLKNRQGHILHTVTKRFGFRTVQVRKGDGFYVNGAKIRFKGVNYHAFWPSSGRTLSKEQVIKDVRLIKGMNMNAVRLSHYPRAPYFYQVCDSLGLFVTDELAGWQNSYDTGVGRKLVKEMVTANVNHPSIVMWNNGNEGGYNFDLDNEFTKWDPQGRPVNHPGSIYGALDSKHYPSYQAIKNILNGMNKVFFPDEFLHGLYDGGGGAGLADNWQLMRNSSRSAGGFIWAYVDECVQRVDKGDSLDCDGNHAPDGMVGPYRHKEGSYNAIRSIWSPVQIKKNQISSQWNKRLWVGNQFFYTNLKQVKFIWKLMKYPGPFDRSTKGKVVKHGIVKSPDVKPQSSGFLNLNLPLEWRKADMLQIEATDSHGRDIYQWSLPITSSRDWASRVARDTTGTSHIKQTESEYVLRSKQLTVGLNKKSGYITKVQKGGQIYSLSDGPFLAGDSCSVQSMSRDGQNVTAKFSKDSYQVSYALKGDWLKLTYRYRPHGEYPYFGVSFKYPENEVTGIKWLGDGPYRVWKNRLAGAEPGLWHKKNKTYPNQVTTGGYHWHLPKFSGYYSNLNWAVITTKEGPITVVNSTPGIYLGLLQPHFPPHPGQATAKYPDGNLSFLQAISPIGSKFRGTAHYGPSSQENQFQYGYNRKAHRFFYKNTLWLYFGEKR